MAPKTTLTAEQRRLRTDNVGCLPPPPPPPIEPFSACVSLPIVLDAFDARKELASYRLELNNIQPEDAVAPFELDSFTAISTRAIVRNLSITDSTISDTLIVIEADLDIPVLLNMTDADGMPATATSVITLHERVIMMKPHAAKFPFQFEVLVAIRNLEGVYNEEEDAFDVNACIYEIFKLQADALVTLRNLFLCPLRAPIEEGNEDCETFFDLPNYPYTLPRDCD